MCIVQEGHCAWPAAIQPAFADAAASRFVQAAVTWSESDQEFVVRQRFCPKFFDVLIGVEVLSVECGVSSVERGVQV